MSALFSSRCTQIMVNGNIMLSCILHRKVFSWKRVSICHRFSDVKLSACFLYWQAPALCANYSRGLFMTKIIGTYLFINKIVDFTFRMKLSNLFQKSFTQKLCLKITWTPVSQASSSSIPIALQHFLCNHHCEPCLVNLPSVLRNNT